MYGLRLQGVVDDPVTITLDWFRLYEGRPEHDVVVTYSANEPITYSDAAAVDPDAAVDAGQTWGRLRPRYRSATTSTVHVGGLPAGTWYLHDPEGTLLGTVRIRPRPHPEILDPDMAGGVDYATEVLGNPWDFSDRGDVLAVGNTRDVRFSGGELSASTRATTRGSACRWAPTGSTPSTTTGSPSTSTTTRPSTSTTGRAHQPDPGRQPRTPAVAHRRHPQDGRECAYVSDGREFVLYKTWDRYTYDMADVPAAQGMSSSAEPNIGVSHCGTGPDPHWTALGPLTFLRLDPHEAPSQYRWYVDELRIAADDAAAPTFDVTWVDHDPIPGTQVTVRLADDRSGDDGEVLARVDQAPGTNRLTFDATDRLPETYWVTLTSRTPDGRENRDVSTGPLQVSPRIQGANRNATAVEVSRQSFTAARTAVIASPRPSPTPSWPSSSPTPSTDPCC